MLNKFRELMKANGIDTYIITKLDPHQSEYSPTHYMSVEFISGFSGSNAIVIITQDKAAIWTDGRYEIQIKNQIYEGFEIFILPQPNVKDYPEYCIENTPEGGTLGFDGKTISVMQFNKMERGIKQKKINIKCDIDLVGEIWTKRPPLSSSEIFEHDIKFSGTDRKQKLQSVREKMKPLHCTNYLISSLVDIAWLLNLRGSDIAYNPVFRSYFLIKSDSATLFVPLEKLPTALKSTLEADGINIEPYESITEHLKAIDNSIIINYSNTNYLSYSCFKEKAYAIEIDHDITAQLKAVKSDIELKNIFNAQIKDGVAMVQFIKWLKENADGLDEYEIGEKVDYFRSLQQNYVCPSFDVIAAYNANAAMMHYSADKNSAARICKSGAILIDSGGQYFDGTTDITRTITVGEVSDEFKDDFTYVLKSHIAIATAVFLFGTSGSALDVLARKPMWDVGMNYKSGTGHGLGYFLGVHEGPHRISPVSDSVRLEAGMLITNEPGVYKESKHGIRTENTVVVKEFRKTECGTFMNFETISFCPIDTDCINKNLLNQQEINWLNDYHKLVFDKLSPFLDEDDKAWLERATQKI